MKKKLLLIMLSILSGTVAYTQEAGLPEGKSKIILKNGEPIEEAMLWNINSTLLEYEKNGSLHDIVLEEIHQIKNGAQIYVADSGKIVHISPHSSETSEWTNRISTDFSITQAFEAKAEEDARKNYRGYKSAATGTFITTMLFPPFGLLPAAACSAVQPAEHTMNYPDAAFKKNEVYKNAYRKKAHGIKAGKVWGNFGIAILTDVLIVGLLVAAAR